MRITSLLLGALALAQLTSLRAELGLQREAYGVRSEPEIFRQNSARLWDDDAAVDI